MLWNGLFGRGYRLLFPSRWVEESDLDRIHDNQAKIEQHLNEELPELNLTNLASEEAPEALLMFCRISFICLIVKFDRSLKTLTRRRRFGEKN